MIQPHYEIIHLSEEQNKAILNISWTFFEKQLLSKFQYAYECVHAPVWRWVTLNVGRVELMQHRQEMGKKRDMQKCKS